jgi:S1-C subfamily serine protease
VEIFRDGRTQKISLQLASGESAAARQPRSAKAASGWLGIDVDELPRSKAQAGLSGVIVTAVEPDSAAAGSGIQRGDIIMSVNQRKTASLKEYATAMKEAEKRGSVALLVRRGSSSIYFALKLR